MIKKFLCGKTFRMELKPHIRENLKFRITKKEKQTNIKTSCHLSEEVRKTQRKFEGGNNKDKGRI